MSEFFARCFGAALTAMIYITALLVLAGCAQTRSCSIGVALIAFVPAPVLSCEVTLEPSYPDRAQRSD